MNLINFKDIDFNQSIDNSTEIIEFNGSQIQVLKYLPSPAVTFSTSKS